jgi:hypothetical protein
MRHVKESSNKKVLEFATPQDSIGGQQVNWLPGVVAPAFRVGRGSIIVPQSGDRS